MPIRNILYDLIYIDVIPPQKGGEASGPYTTIN